MADKKKVAIDSDFFNKFTETDVNGILFMHVMNELNLSPIFHEFVYNEELFCNSSAKKLVESGFISVIEYRDIVKIAEEEEEYRELFCSLFLGMNGEEFTGDMFRHVCCKNFGEIHSSVMSILDDIDILYSDDSAAKRYIEEHISNRHSFRIGNIFDIFFSLKEIESSLKWSEIKGFLKLNLRRSRYQEIKEKWHS